MKYRAKSGDVLDAVCTAYYGLGKFDLDVVFAANPGLADLGVVIPSGTMIDLPAMAIPETGKARIRLWN